ncbi:unnamed protein product [Meloidogyne enterolobii]|uniref:Uncharacterized protein n=1 Tax=Meloidogyne enterolobii TaxID=390850 RepID=A0ACB1A7C9_MELEN
MSRQFCKFWWISMFFLLKPICPSTDFLPFIPLTSLPFLSFHDESVCYSFLILFLYD